MKRVHRKVKTSDILGMHRHSRGAIARSKSIDHQLDEDREKRQNEVQLLILGGASAGKSTFIKQLRYYHGDGYPDDERLRFTSAILENLNDGIHQVLGCMKRLNVIISDERVQSIAEEFQRNCPIVNVTRLQPEAGEIQNRKCAAAVCNVTETIAEHRKNFVDIVECKEFRECYSRRQTSGIRLYCAEEYFLENVARITANNYIPSVQDILYIRKPTLGVQEHNFNVDSLLYRVIDVAGQKNQRKKWIHFFDSVTAVVFFASLSGYNEKLEEDSSINNIHDSLQTFRELAWNEFLDKTDFILFLNKHDIFVKGVKQVSIKSAFPEYRGVENDAAASLDYIKRQFMAQPPRDKQVYAHISTATNMDLMKAIISDVVNIIMEINNKKNQAL